MTARPAFVSPVCAPLRLVVFISGGGTTLKNLLDRIAAGRLDAQVLRVLSSSERAGGLRFAAEAGIPADVIRRSDFATVADYSRAMFDAAGRAGPDLVVMGGFLKFVEIPADYELRVVNVHPALIPAFSGQGMYGLRVHQAVLDLGAKITGCTVHFVDNQYDHGPIILQRAVEVAADDTPESLQARVMEAEREALPEALRLYAAGRIEVAGRRVTIRPA